MTVCSCRCVKEEFLYVQCKWCCPSLAWLEQMSVWHARLSKLSPTLLCCHICAKVRVVEGSGLLRHHRTVLTVIIKELCARCSWAVS